jgi:signal transduction histidine kinase
MTKICQPDATALGITPKDINAFIFDALLSIQPEADARQIQLHPCLAFDLPPCGISEPSFKQVLRILLRHACNAAANDDPTRRVVTIRTATNESGAIVLEIINSADVYPETTGPMQTESNPDADLQFCHATIQAHGGTLEVRTSANSPDAAIRMELPPSRRRRP